MENEDPAPEQTNLESDNPIAISCYRVDVCFDHVAFFPFKDQILTPERDYKSVGNQSISNGIESHLFLDSGCQQ